MKKVANGWLISTIALALMSTQIAAQEKSPSACRGDVEKFCASVQPRQEGVRRCLKEHESELSEGCRSEIASNKERMQGFMQACSSDIESFCKDVKPGGGRIYRCLQENRSRLSQDCAGTLTKGSRE